MSAPRRTIFIVVLIFLAGGLRAQSFLEQYGFGQVQPEADVVGQGMGGITVLPMGLNSSHFSLPASWHRTRRTKLQIGLIHNEIEVDGGGSFSRDALQHFQFLAHLTNRAAYGVVLRPLTRVDISILATDSTDIGGSNLAYDQHRTISGGQSALTVGYSRRISSRLSLGLALDVVFGSLTQADTVLFIGSERRGDLFEQLVAEQRLEFVGKVLAISLLADQVGGSSGLLGFQLRLPLDLTIVTHTSNSVLSTGSQKRRLEAGLPLEARVGYGWSPAPNHLLATELGWSSLVKPNANNDLVFRRHIKKIYELRLGWSKVPVGAEKLDPTRLYYRVGFYYRTYYISRPNNVSLGEIGLTAGLGYRSLPLGQRVDLALQLGRREAPSGMGEERFVNLSLGVTTGELWFLRPKKKWD